MKEAEVEATRVFSLDEVSLNICPYFEQIYTYALFWKNLNYQK
jgi:hypothetical protein